MEIKCRCDTLFESIEKHGDNIYCLEYLLRKKRFSTNVFNRSNEAPLIVCSKLGYPFSIKLLLNYGANPSERYLNKLCIYYSIIIDNIDCVHTLLNFGNWYVTQDDIYSFFDTAKSIEMLKCLKLFEFNLNANVVYTESFRMFPILKKYIDDKNISKIDMFLKAGANPHCDLEFNRTITLYYYALNERNFELLKCFIDNGINPKIFIEFSYDDKLSLLKYFIGNVEAVKYLLEKGVDPNIIEDNNIPILFHLARELSNCDIENAKIIASLLIDYGVDKTLIHKSKNIYEQLTSSFSRPASFQLAEHILNYHPLPEIKKPSGE